MNLTPVRIVARKELVDGFRDRRSTMTLFATMIFGALIIAFMLNQIAGQKKAADTIVVPVVGIEHAPMLVNWLQQQSGVDVVPGPENPEAAVRDHATDVVLVIKDGFGTNFGQSKPASVQVFSDSTRKSSQPKVARLDLLLNSFNAETATLRLIVRGVSPEVVRPLKVEAIDVANSQQRAAAILNVMLMIVMMAVITAGMQIATDSTAGERERRSLEPLLLNPVPRWQIVTGKWLAASTAAFLAMVVSLLLFSVILSKLPLQDAGIRFELDRQKILALITAMGPLALVVPAIQEYLSSFAKSFKEAQSYTIILVLPMVFMGMISTFYPAANRPWLTAVPLLSQYSLAADVLAGRFASPVVLIACASEALAVAMIFLWLAARLFSTERIVFGR